MLSNTNTYELPVSLTRNSPNYDVGEACDDVAVKRALTPDSDDQLDYEKPLPKVQNFDNPNYDGGASTIRDARPTTDEPLYETPDDVRQSDE